MDNPRDLADSKGFGTVNLSLETLGVCIGSIVAFSNLAMLIGGGLPRFRSGPVYKKVEVRTKTVPIKNYHKG